MLGLSTDQIMFGLYCSKLVVEVTITMLVIWLAHRLKHDDATPTAHL